ncbi:luciferin 4-monooxygenase-like isoform X2 [Arctopsyche grandis]
MSIGAISAPLNILYTEHELIHAMGISKPKLIFCSPLTAQKIMTVMKDVPSLQKLICYGNNKPNPSITLYKDLFDQVSDTSKFELAKVDIYKQPLIILCSSGTTGLAKGVALSHHNFLLVSSHLKRLLIDVNSPDDCLLSLIPWFHAYGFITHVVLLALKIRYVFMVKFEEVAFLSAIQNHKVTITMLVPPLLVFLAKHPLVDKYNLSSLKELWCGAAPLAKETQIAVQKRIGVKRIQQGYGMTETTLAVLHNGNSEVKPGSCGLVVPGTTAKVVDLQTGESLGPYKEGELCFKGPLMMLGYVGDTASTQNIYDSEGWLHTGDVGYFDKDQYFYVVDRIKELIKYKGFQVPPAEIEAILLECSAVRDVGVVGLPDERAGELPIAFVVIQPGAKVTEKDLIKFVADRVSVPKQLHGGVRFVKEIPKNPSGKILRRELRELLKQTPTSKL